MPFPPAVCSAAALLLLTCVTVAASARPLRYELDVQLDAEAHAIDGRGVIELENSTPLPLSELAFHLYLNAFKNDRTRFLRSPFERARGGRTPERWGRIDVTELRVAGSERELWASAVFPGQREGDETWALVELPEPLAPGETLELSITWRSRLPSVVDRTGFSADYHFAGQWFPKLAKLEPRGFEVVPFHPYAEFHADFSDYHVTIDVPSHFIVGASGKRTDSETNGERRRDTFAAPRVIDFAWTAWPHFEQHDATIAGVDVHFLLPPGHATNLARTRAALEHALPWMAERYGAYPYADLTVVHPPHHAAASGGMEYPQLITTGGAWHSSHWSRAVEQVTLHELGHQWFQSVLASNEREEPFLDEGFASFVDGQLMQARAGNASGAKLLGLEVSALAYYRVLALARGHDTAIARRAGDFPSFLHLGALVYGRTATLLHTLERVHGESFSRAMRDYTSRFRFAHPRAEDWIGSIERGVHPEAATRVRRALYERGWVDYAVTQVESTPVAAPQGELPPGFTDPLAAAVESGHLGRVVVVRRGTLSWPVEVELHTEDGHVERRLWDGEGDFHEFEVVGASPLRAAVVDPDRRILLDEDLFNNQRTRTPRPARRSAALLTFVTQVLTQLFGP